MIRYEIKTEWNGDEGWRFAFGDKRIWQVKKGFMYACLDSKDYYTEHKLFDNMEDALNYMRLQ